jgi:type II restriction enzyme
VTEALGVLIELGMPPAQQNERSALVLLALLNLSPEKRWDQAEAPFIGVTPIMQFIRKHYEKEYAPNTRETVRRQTLHPFVAATIALYNPDMPLRPVNSPNSVYQVEPNTLVLLKTFGCDR